MQPCLYDGSLLNCLIVKLFSCEIVHLFVFMHLSVFLITVLSLPFLLMYTSCFFHLHVMKDAVVCSGIATCWFSANEEDAEKSLRTSVHLEGVGKRYQTKKTCEQKEEKETMFL